MLAAPAKKPHHMWPPRPHTKRTLRSSFRQGLGFVMPVSSQRTLRHIAELLYTMPLIQVL